jgi:phosphoglycolate phosphatase
MREIHNILFDLDGTLVDSSGAIRASLAHALERSGLGFPQDRPVERMIGLPLLDIFRDEFGLTGAAAERAIADYRAHYDAEAQAGTRIYDHVETCLEALRAAGCKLVVATVKPSPIAAKVLSEMGLAPYFCGVAGSSMDHARRDKGDIIRHALQTYGLDPAHSAMVGDRAQDIRGARSNRLCAVGVTWGFGSPEELAAAAPDHLVGCCSELAGLLLQRSRPTAVAAKVAD